MHLLHPCTSSFLLSLSLVVSCLVHWTKIRTVNNLQPWFIFKIVPVTGKTVIVLLTCLRAHIASCVVLCKAVGVCFKFTLIADRVWAITFWQIYTAMWSVLVLISVLRKKNCGAELLRVMVVPSQIKPHRAEVVASQLIASSQKGWLCGEFFYFFRSGRKRKGIWSADWFVKKL